MTSTTLLIARIEDCYDAIPRTGGARVEQIGPFDLFVREGAGWPYYARPRRGTTVAPADVEAVRARQAELGVPEAFEWVDEICPTALPAAEAAGLRVLLAPLMVLDPSALPSPSLPGVSVRLLGPDDPDFAESYAAREAVARIGFGAGGTERGTAGPAERDAALQRPVPQAMEQAADRARQGYAAYALAETVAEGVLATGAIQMAAGAAEVVGVATLPSARRRGLGAAVSAVLARYALESGADPVFLGAASEDVARVYASVGFRRIGTACIAEPAALT